MLQRHICIVIPAYNCELFVEKNLQSVLFQEYSNFEVVYVDDCSTDNTVEKVNAMVAKFKEVNFTIVKNTKRVLRGENIYNAIHKNCAPDTIVTLLDGDDWLVDDQVLSRVNAAYQSKDVWMTFGGFIMQPDVGGDKKQYNLHYPEEWVNTKKYRDTRWTCPHLLTFYAWLYFCIKKEDLLSDGQFIKYSEDLAMVIPMLEMANSRWYCFSFEAPLYVWNRENPLGTGKTVRFEQVEAEMIVRKRPKYSPLIDFKPNTM